MAGRTLSDEPLPAFLKPADHVAEPILEARGIAKSFGGSRPCRASTSWCATAAFTR